MYISHSSRCRHALARVILWWVGIYVKMHHDQENGVSNALLYPLVSRSPHYHISSGLIEMMREEELTPYYHPCPWASSSSFPLSTNPRRTWGPCFPSIYLDHHREGDHKHSLLDHGLLVSDLTILIYLLYRFVASGVLC